MHNLTKLILRHTIISCKDISQFYWFSKKNINSLNIQTHQLICFKLNYQSQVQRYRVHQPNRSNRSPLKSISSLQTCHIYKNRCNLFILFNSITPMLYYLTVMIEFGWLNTILAYVTSGRSHENYSIRYANSIT